MECPDLTDAQVMALVSLHGLAPAFPRSKFPISFVCSPEGFVWWDAQWIPLIKRGEQRPCQWTPDLIEDARRWVALNCPMP